jgi:hypothetical protein
MQQVYALIIVEFSYQVIDPIDFFQQIVGQLFHSNFLNLIVQNFVDAFDFIRVN